MSSKKAAPPLKKPSRERVESALRAGDFAAAVAAAQALHAHAPTTEHLLLRKRALQAAAEAFAVANRPIQALLGEADTLTPHDPVWVAELATWLARAGQLAEAQARTAALGDPTLPARLLALAADGAVCRKSADGLPDDLRPGLDAILNAFRNYEAGDDAAVREALQPVGLQSPFLDWKVFLRGLIAHSTHDETKAIENWSRLDPARIPYLLTAPLRAAIDTGFRVAMTPEAAAICARQQETRTGSSLFEGLRAIRSELGQDKSLANAFKHASKVVPELKTAAPHLVPRLANCFYHNIVHHGQPDDLSRFRNIFGEPRDDPRFDRLQAQVNEQIDRRRDAQKHWAAYEKWLATNPPGWPADVAARARAFVWNRMAVNALRHEERQEEDDEGPFGFFAPPRRARETKLEPDPETCLRQATQLAPDWPEPALDLIERCLEKKKTAEAEKVARAFLAREPGHLEMLTKLAGLLDLKCRYAEATEVWLQAAAVQPLDRVVCFRTSLAILNESRAQLAVGKPEAARAFLDRHHVRVEAEAPGHLFGLESVIALKLGETENANLLRERAETVPGQRLSAAYRVSVDATLAGLKPAQKTEANRRFKSAMVPNATPLEVNQLIAASEAYHLSGVVYRGQKTHDKQVLDQVKKCLKAEAPAEDFERLGEILLVKENYKPLHLLVAACETRFPENPYFLFARAALLLDQRKPWYLAKEKLDRAKKIIERSNEPRHKPLLERIDEMSEMFATPLDMLGRLFGGGFGGFDEDNIEDEDDDP